MRSLTLFLLPVLMVSVAHGSSLSKYYLVYSTAIPDNIKTNVKDYGYSGADNHNFEKTHYLTLPNTNYSILIVTTKSTAETNVLQTAVNVGYVKLIKTIKFDNENQPPTTTNYSSYPTDAFINKWWVGESTP